MRTVKLRLTHLIKIYNKKNDLLKDQKGTSVYSKEVADLFKKIYKICDNMSNYKENLEYRVARNNVLYALDEIKKYQPTDFRFEFNDLDHFLYLICELQIKVQNIYSCVILNIETFQTKLNKYQIILSEYKDIYSEIIEIKTTINDDLKIIDKDMSELSEMNSVSKKLIKSYEDKANVIEEKYNICKNRLSRTINLNNGLIKKYKKWEEKLNENKQTIKQESDKVYELGKEANQDHNRILFLKKIIEKENNLISNQRKLAQEHQEKIEETLGDFSRAMVAGSFKDRKNELKATVLLWMISTIISGLFLIGITLFFYYPIMNGGLVEFNWNHLFYKIPIITGLIWLVWFSSQQYGFAVRLKEDYSYKYAISMAFEGYKDIVSEIDIDLLDALMSLTINHITDSPLRIFKNSIPSNPFEKHLDEITNIIKNKKIKVKAPNIEATLEQESD